MKGGERMPTATEKRNNAVEYMTGRKGLNDYTQAGNIIFGFATTGDTEYDICSQT